MRAHLARLLDAGTRPAAARRTQQDHLDLEALIWFQEYLTTYPGAIVVISHDREFLNHIVSGIVEIRFRVKLNRYRGGASTIFSCSAPPPRSSCRLAAYKNQQRDIARLREFADRFSAKASKASQAQKQKAQAESSAWKDESTSE